jgi:hypothetical protein
MAVAFKKCKRRTKSTGASVKYQYFCRIISNEAEVVLQYFASSMKVQLAGLGFVIGAIFISIFYLAWGLTVTLFFWFVGLDFDSP